MTEEPAARSAFQQLLEDLRTNVKLADNALSKLLDDLCAGREGVGEDVGTTLRQLRADISQVLAELDATTTDERAAYLAEARRRLAAARSVLDEMWVRGALGRQEARDQTEQVLTAAENAWLAARNRLGEVQQDVNRAATDARADLEASLQSFGSALSAARAAFARETGG
jgi:hypothetical protein